MTLERAIEIALAEAERFEENAQELSRDAQDLDGKCMTWANAYREKARALRMIAEKAKEDETHATEQAE